MKQKIWIRLPDSLKPMLPTIRKLAGTGLNKGQICRQLGITVNAFSKYREVNECFEDGRSDLAVEVAKAFKNNLEFSYSDRVHLSKALRLYASGFDTEEIVDVASAQSALAKSIKEFAAGRLNIDDMETIRKSCSTFADLVVSTSLEERLQALEDNLAGRMSHG